MYVFECACLIMCTCVRACIYMYVCVRIVSVCGCLSIRVRARVRSARAFVYELGASVLSRCVSACLAIQAIHTGPFNCMPLTLTEALFDGDMNN